MQHDLGLIRLNKFGMGMLFFIAAGLLSSGATAEASPSITYQGYLQKDGEPFTGTASTMVFSLYGQEADGAPLAPAVEKQNVSVSDGYFSVDLEFGAPPFLNSDKIWMEIVVDGATLQPRQRVNMSPMAIRALAVDADGLPTSSDVYVSSSTTGGTASLALSAAGHPLVAYNDENSLGADDDQIGFISCSDPRCEDASQKIIDSGNLLGIDLALSDEGLPLLAYVSIITDNSTGEQSFVGNLLACSDQECSSWTAESPGESVWGNENLQFMSVTLHQRPSGNPFLIYEMRYESGDRELLGVDCADTACGSNTSQVIATGGAGFGLIDVTTGPNGFPALLLDRGDPGILICSDANCTSSTEQAVPTISLFGGRGSIFDNGLLAIAYRDQSSDELRLYNCLDETCSSGNDVLVETYPPNSSYVFAMSQDGLPFIVSDGILFIACREAECSSSFKRGLDTGDSGSVLDFKTRDDGSPVVLYRGAWSGLKVYSCVDSMCRL